MSARLIWASLALLGVRAENLPCPELLPYSPEPSPFGWPLSPADWAFGREDCWRGAHEMCGGLRQSPMNIDTSLGAVGCDTSDIGPDGAFAGAAQYTDSVSGFKVKPSKYMGTIMAEGTFGNLTAIHGATDAEYEAVQIHVAAPSLHTIDGQTYDAELFVLHRPRSSKDMREESVAVSVLFKNSEAGEYSALLENLGLPRAGGKVEANSAVAWDSTGSLNLQAAMAAPLAGKSYAYNGSVPVPPCSEKVKWVILGAAQPISPQQTTELRSLLFQVRGGAPHRAVKERSQDRCVAVNSRQVGGAHHHDTCRAEYQAGTWMLAASCWEAKDRCWGKRWSSADIITADATLPDEDHPKLKFTALGHYHDVEHVLVKPSLYTLDAHLPEQGDDFGNLLLNGHAYFATNISFKAVSQHTIDGQQYAGELLIEHVLYGDRFESITTELHKVMISVPLSLGGENQLLRKFDLSDSTSRTIRDGLEYDVHHRINLQEELEEQFAGDWYWYSSNATHKDCGTSVRWMVFATPLEISIEQLNYLTVPVSGVDSSHTPYPAPKGSFWKNHIPDYAVETNETECENLLAPDFVYGESNPHWSHGNERCWAFQYPVCDAGMSQSPINIPVNNISGTGHDNFLAKTSWKPVEGLKVTNTGHGVQVSSQQFGYVTYINEKGFPDYYQVAQMHIHMPSEHMIDGKQFAAEMHIVHMKQNTVLDLAGDDLLVTGIMFDIGEESPVLKQIFEGSEELKNEGDSWDLTHPLDPMWAFGPVIDGPYYRYDGGLTTPPCSEVVKWFVFENHLTMSKEQFQKFKALYPNPNNNRPIQPLNDRKVYKNSFQQGSPVDFRFFLNREMGHDRETISPPVFILFPIAGTLALMSVVMAATFVRADPQWKSENAGGLEATPIGRSRQ